MIDDAEAEERIENTITDFDGIDLCKVDKQSTSHARIELTGELEAIFRVYSMIRKDESYEVSIKRAISYRADAVVTVWR